MIQILPRTSWVLFGASLLLPALESRQLSGAGPIRGWELVVTLPFLGILLGVFRGWAETFLLAYVVLLCGANAFVATSGRLVKSRRGGLQGPSVFAVVALASAISPIAGFPAALGISIERLLVGYYCWAASVATAAIMVFMYVAYAAYYDYAA